MERLQEKPRIDFVGPPKTFGEAIYRLPDNSHPRIKKDFELQILSSLKQNIENVLMWHLDGPIENRVLRGITKDSFALMERWSFKRGRLSTRIHWHHNTLQSQFYNMLPSAKNARKRLYFYDMEPELDQSPQSGVHACKLICVEAQYKNENGDIKRSHEYLLGFVTEEEYDLLHKTTPSE